MLSKIFIFCVLFFLLSTGRLLAQERMWIKSIGFEIHNMRGSLSDFNNVKIGPDGLFLKEKLQSTGGGIFWNIRKRGSPISLQLGAGLFFENAKWGFHDIFYGAAFTVDSGYYFTTYSVSYLQIPVSIRYDLRRSGARPFLEAGGAAGIPLSRESHGYHYYYASATPTGDGYPNVVLFRDFGYTAFLGLGVGQRFGRWDIQAEGKFVSAVQTTLGSSYNSNYAQFGLGALWTLQ